MALNLDETGVKMTIHKNGEYDQRPVYRWQMDREMDDYI